MSLPQKSSALGQLRVSQRELSETLESCRAEYSAAVAGYEANLDEFAKEGTGLRKSNEVRRCCASLPSSHPRAHPT
eukprot:COSAG04_NODE_814_length_10091_cov_7.591873_2_plen_76_part_00